MGAGACFPVLLLRRLALATCPDGESSPPPPTHKRTYTPVPQTHSLEKPQTHNHAVGAPITVSKFLTANLLPVTLGNIIGGALLALSQGYVFGRLGKPKAEPWKVA